MPRNMSFAITTRQAYEKTKDVTRRLGWWFLEPGDLVQQVEKAMGLKKGEKVKKIHLTRVVDTCPECLHWITEAEVLREGFPDLTPGEFVAMFCKHNKCLPDEIVNRIEFEYVYLVKTYRGHSFVRGCEFADARDKRLL